jgi:ABC-type transporter Mla subunit MlaD
MEATANLDTTDAIDVVDTLATAQDDLSAAQSVISEVKGELDGPHAERLHTAVRALQGVLDDLEDGHDTAEELLDALR